MTQLTANIDMDDHWHLDKKVPIALIFAIVMQSIAVVWTFAGVIKDIEALKAATMLQKERDLQQDKAMTDNSSLLRQQLDRIDAKLDRLIEKQR